MRNDGNSAVANLPRPPTHLCRSSLPHREQVPPDCSVSLTDWERVKNLRNGNFLVLDHEPSGGSSSSSSGGGGNGGSSSCSSGGGSSSNGSGSGGGAAAVTTAAAWQQIESSSSFLTSDVFDGFA